MNFRAFAGTIFINFERFSHHKLYIVAFSKTRNSKILTWALRKYHSNAIEAN